MTPRTLAEIVADIRSVDRRADEEARGTAIDFDLLVDQMKAKLADELADAVDGGYVQASAWIEDNDNDSRGIWNYVETDAVSGAPLYALTTSSSGEPMRPMRPFWTENRIRDEFGTFSRGPLVMLPRVAR